MKNTNNNEVIFLKKINGMNVKCKKNTLTNKKYVYIKYLDRISGKSKEIDNYVKIGNWVEYRNNRDCINKLNKCLKFIALSLCDEALKVTEKQKESLSFENNNDLQKQKQ